MIDLIEKIIHSGLFKDIFLLIVGAIFGIITKLLYDKRTKTEERFTKLYAPFAKLVIKETHHSAYYFSNFSEETQKNFIDLLYDNYEFTDKELRKRIYEFSCAYHEKCMEECNTSFYKVHGYIDDEFDRLSKKLFYRGGPLIKKR